MSDVLVLAELGSHCVRRTTLSAISAARTAARISGGTFSILLLGHELDEATGQLAVYGAERLLVCDHPLLEHFTAEWYSPTAAAAAARFGLLLATASSFGKDLVPRVAARLQAAYAADCSGIRSEEGRLAFERPMYAGNVLGVCTLLTAIQTATVRQSEFAPAEPLAGVSSPVECFPFVQPGEAAERVEFIGMTEVKSARPALTEARAVVAGGRPLKERFFEVLAPLADELGAAIGATRAVCDGGYAPGDYQVGQTGKVVAPELYVAVGISGALQHVAGMRNARVVVAINRDPEAPIFRVADYGLVADVFEAVPAITEALRERKRSR